jgi:hypothetical protein
MRGPILDSDDFLNSDFVEKGTKEVVVVVGFKGYSTETCEPLQRPNEVEQCVDLSQGR